MMLSLEPSLAGTPAPEPAPTGLMCDLLAAPALVELRSAQPRFSWIVNSHLPNEAQSAYQLLVRTADDGAAWDTGKTASDHSTAVAYAGTALASRQAYKWRVRTWNRQGTASAWSAWQPFRMGIVRTSPGIGDERITVARYPLQVTAVSPAKTVSVGVGHEFLDFGRDAFAGLTLTLTSPEAGRVVVVHMGEVLSGPSQINRAPGGSRRYHRAELTLAAGTHTYTVPLIAHDARLMPPSVGPVMPFRYVELENCPLPVVAHQNTAHYLFDDTASRFDSADPTLNAVWDLCRYTMKATSFCGVFVDGDRERLPYEADAYINQLGYYAADREFTIARYSHEYLLLHGTWPTEWASHSVMMAWEDYLATGDDRSMAAFYDDLKLRTLLSLARPDGLISTTEPPVSPALASALHMPRLQDIVDWPPPERDGYDMKPVNTVVNAFHYHSLVLMAQIADALHKTQDAAMLRASAARAAQSFNAKLFDPQTGLYVDGEGSSHSSLHANMCALAFGLVPPERVAHVADFVAGKGMACSVYGAQYLLEALYHAGKGAAAHALMVAPGDRSWAHWVNTVHTTMTLEAWDNKYKPNQDWNHAWGAAPANIIPRGLMGIQPLEPGFRRMRIQPQPGGLAWASIDLPTVRGPVHAAFHSTEGKLTLTVRLPANTSAQVALPAQGLSDPHVLVDGVRHAGRMEGDFVVIDTVGSGAHTLTR